MTFPAVWPGLPGRLLEERTGEFGAPMDGAASNRAVRRNRNWAFAVQWALAQNARRSVSGLKPSVFVGTGVGESVAACLSGTMTLDEGLRGVAGWPRVEEPVSSPLRAEGHVLLNLAGPSRTRRSTGRRSWAMPAALGKLRESDVPIDWGKLPRSREAAADSAAYLSFRTPALLGGSNTAAFFPSSAAVLDPPNSAGVRKDR